jgi:hypothetical protein
VNQQKLGPVCALLAALLVAVPAAQAQVPTFEEVVGHAFGERATQHHQMVAYLHRLAETSTRVTVTVQGASWEGRELMLAVVTSPENHARIEEIRTGSLRLADPRGTTPEQAQSLIRSQPAVVWFGGSIHGFELSGAEGALKLLEHLTTRDDAATLEVLENTVVLIDPMLNPDGREAFVQINYQNEGREPNPDPQDWANSFTFWQALKFRTGHYYFDTNRDWFAHTQRETRDRMPHLHAWRAQVAVDMHEMGSGQEFFFDPPTDPTNRHFPAFALRWFQLRLGRFPVHHARAVQLLLPGLHLQPRVPGRSGHAVRAGLEPRPCPGAPRRHGAHAGRRAGAAVRSGVDGRPHGRHRPRGIAERLLRLAAGGDRRRATGSAPLPDCQ